MRVVSYKVNFRVSNSSTAAACACTLAPTVLCSSKHKTTFLTFCFKCYFLCARRIIIYAWRYFSRQGWYKY